MIPLGHLKLWFALVNLQRERDGRVSSGADHEHMLSCLGAILNILIRPVYRCRLLAGDRIPNVELIVVSENLEMDAVPHDFFATFESIHRSASTLSAQERSDSRESDSALTIGFDAFAVLVLPHFGLDVHKDSIAIAYTTARSRKDAIYHGSRGGSNLSIERALRKLAEKLEVAFKDLKVCYSRTE